MTPNSGVDNLQPQQLPTGLETTMNPSGHTIPEKIEATSIPKSTKGSDDTIKNENDLSAQNDEPIPKVDDDCPASPQIQQQQHPQKQQQHHTVFHHQAYLPHLTPQRGGGYYLYGSQVTPEPPSPVTPGYDVNSFFHQQAAMFSSNAFGSAAAAGQYGQIPPPPLSPNLSSGFIPPPSPLFPRPSTTTVAGTYDPSIPMDSSFFQRAQSQTMGVPSVPYLASPMNNSNAAAAFNAAYSSYAMSSAAYANGFNGGIPNVESAVDDRRWADRSNLQQLHYSQASPHHGPTMYSAMPKTVRNDRSFSLDEMLPPAALDAQDPNNATSYGAPYAMNQTSSSSPHYTQSWGYGSAGDVYNSPVPSVQQPPVPSSIPSPYPGSTIPGAIPSQLHSMPNYGGPSMSPFYNSTSPGPPIQTTSSNKGPDGANLFIFHIPNHYTNLDMYRLFYQYGNLLSVRIMVEKDTGRSRGFGFVSYDLPESAALAIKALNGFPIGNKRLKVQHKQIRDCARGSFDGQDCNYANQSSEYPYLRPPTEILDEGVWRENNTASSNPPVLQTYLGENRESNGFVDSGSSDLVDNSPPLTKDSSPLSSLDPILAALPEVSGPIATVE